MTSDRRPGGLGVKAIQREGKKNGSTALAFGVIASKYRGDDRCGSTQGVLANGFDSSCVRANK